MKAFIASILAAVFGIFAIHIPGFYTAAIAISIVFSLITAALCFTAAKGNRSQVSSASGVFMVAGVFAVLTAIAGTFRLSEMTNSVPVSAGFDLLGWLAGAVLTIGMSGAAALAVNARRRNTAR